MPGRPSAEASPPAEAADAAMIQIAHLSDLHFGSRFDIVTWNAVEAAVVDFGPDLIVVSGDLIDGPDPLQLLAARCGLRDLARRVRERHGNRRAAELIVVPGNHDVFGRGLYIIGSGLSIFQPRMRWFERVFNLPETVLKIPEAGKDEAVGKLAGWSRRHYGEDLGLTERFRRRDGWLKRCARRLRFGEGGVPGLHAMRATPQSLVHHAARANILFALIDSNPAGGDADFARGFVDHGKLVKLADLLRGHRKPHLARVAVVHHHVLPIAFTNDSNLRGDPAMALRNAGAVLQVLANHKFDLVLHGHWHKPQFAWFDLALPGGGQYPMAVAAAGSAALTTEHQDGNCVNFITIAGNGRITVEALLYGKDNAINRATKDPRYARKFTEPIGAVKRRAHVRALERHGVECDRLVRAYTVTENGDVLLRHRVEGVSQSSGSVPIQRLFVPVVRPPHGQHAAFKAFALNEDPLEQPEAVADGYFVRLPGGGLAPGVTLPSFEFNCSFVNCLTMTLWEAEQRSLHSGSPAPPRNGWDHEHVGALVAVPAARLELSVTLPESLRSIRPKVVCLRPGGFPNYTITPEGNADLPSVSDGDSGTARDADLAREENRHLAYDPSRRTWTVDIEHPMAGYRYRLDWKVPDDGREKPAVRLEIGGKVRDWQTGILRAAEEYSANPPDPATNQAIKAFHALHDSVLNWAKIAQREHWMVGLFIYQAETLSLRPAFVRRSWTDRPFDPAFKVPLGTGIAGAAFLQSRIIPWIRDAAATALIEPEIHPAAPGDAERSFNSMVAIPVYHATLMNQTRPPGWATIGVVVFGTEARGSKVAELSSNDADAQLRGIFLRALVQTQVTAMVDHLCIAMPTR